MTHPDQIPIPPRTVRLDQLVDVLTGQLKKLPGRYWPGFELAIAVIRDMAQQLPVETPEQFLDRMSAEMAAMSPAGHMGLLRALAGRVALLHTMVAERTKPVDGEGDVPR